MLTIVPANEASRQDLQAVLGTRGDPHRCQCQRYKLRRREAFAKGQVQNDSFVFCSSVGTPLLYANVVRRGLSRAAEAAGLNPERSEPLGFHDLRHTFASHLIRQGLDPVRAAKQLGHARASVTLDIYAHEFAAAGSYGDIQEKLVAAFGGLA